MRRPWVGLLWAVEPKGPRCCPGLNTDQACELEDAARMSWPAAEPPEVGAQEAEQGGEGPQ